MARRVPVLLLVGAGASADGVRAGFRRVVGANGFRVSGFGFTVSIRPIETGTKKHSREFGHFLASCFRNPLAGL